MQIDAVEDGGYDHGAHAIAPEIALEQATLDAYVISVLFNRAGDTLFAAAGDGVLYCTLGGTAPFAPENRIGNRIGLAVCAAPAPDRNAVLIGTDGGKLLRASPDGTVETLADAGDRWIDNVASHAGRALIAYSAGKTVWVLSDDGRPTARFPDLVSTPNGLVFSPDGARLAAARYNGVSVLDVAGGTVARELFWRGSHTAIDWSADGSHIATATQDRELHCWRLSDGRDYRMSGYGAKIRSLHWTADFGLYLRQRRRHAYLVVLR